MYSVSYKLINGEKVEYQSVPKSWNSVYSYSQFLTNFCGVSEVDIYFKGAYVDTYKDNRSTRNFEG